MKSELFKCADYDTLGELDTKKGKALLSMAVFLGKTGLIDNSVLGEEVARNFSCIAR